MQVQEYTERGRHLWAFRCWGTDTCDGWLSLGHTSERSARRSQDRHVTEEHHMPTPCTATIQGPSTPRGQLITCAREAGHPENHVGPPQGYDGKVLWSDHNAGAVPHGASSEAQQ